MANRLRKWQSAAPAGPQGAHGMSHFAGLPFVLKPRIGCRAMQFRTWFIAPLVRPKLRIVLPPEASID